MYPDPHLVFSCGIRTETVLSNEHTNEKRLCVFQTSNLQSIWKVGHTPCWFQQEIPHTARFLLYLNVSPYSCSLLCG